MRTLSLLFLLTTSLWAQTGVEGQVLMGVQKMMAESGGRVTFSGLINDPSFSAEEKAFLGRLYEVFFQIPLVLKAELESTGQIPSRSDLGATFAISPRSVDLLLAVMQSDGRVPPLFSRDESGEIESLNLPNIDAFVARRGAQVKVTQWEGQTLPSFQLETLAGGKIGSADLAGKSSLIYFWFTGCPPCGRISPHLAELDSKYSGERFRIIGINADRVLGLDTSDERRAEYLSKLGVKFTNAHLEEATREAFGGINIYPTLFFSDKSGTVVRHFINYQDLDALEAAVKQILGE